MGASCESTHNAFSEMLIFTKKQKGKKIIFIMCSIPTVLKNIILNIFKLLITIPYILKFSRNFLTMQISQGYCKNIIIRLINYICQYKVCQICLE